MRECARQYGLCFFVVIVILHTCSILMPTGEIVSTIQPWGGKRDCGVKEGQAGGRGKEACVPPPSRKRGGGLRTLPELSDAVVVREAAPLFQYLVTCVVLNLTEDLDHILGGAGWGG